MSCKEKWKAMSKFHRIINIIRISILAVIIVFPILGLTNVINLKITSIITMPSMAIASVLHGVYSYKSSKGIAYFMFAVAVFMLITTIIVYNKYFGI